MEKVRCQYKWIDGTRICHEPVSKESEKGFCIFHDPCPTKDTNLFNQKLKKKLQEKNYDFRGYYFPANISFGQKEFNMPISFVNAHFHGLVNFYKTRFAEVDFSKATFSQWAFFGRTTFSDNVKFTNAEFKGVAYLGEATFWNADFTRSKFSEDATFESAVFEKYVNFSGSRFLKCANFENGTFSGRTEFQRADFSGPTIFSRSKFLGTINFTSAVFSKEAEFSYIRFSLGAVFLHTKFCKKASFHDAVFSESVDFTCTSFCNGVDFRKAKFTKEIFFTDSCFESAVNFDNCKLSQLETKPPFQNLDHLESGYRTVKNCLNERGDYSTAGQFYYLEMNAKRKRSQGPKRLWLEMYRFICGYGESPQRVLAASSLIILMWAGMFFFSGVAINPSSADEHIIDYSLTFPSDVSFDNVRDLCYCGYCSIVTFTTLGYGDICPLGYSRFLASIEAFIGAFFIALFVLVFGRKMMR